MALTKEKVNQILKLTIEEYPSLDDEYITIKEGKEFSVTIGNIAHDHIVSYVPELPQDDRLKKNIVSFLKSNYNINEADYMFYDYEEVFGLIHELGHIYYHNAYDSAVEKTCYSNFKNGQFYSQSVAFEAYRNIPMEADADQFALTVLNNQKSKIWALMNGISIEEAEEEINFWNL